MKEQVFYAKRQVDWNGNVKGWVSVTAQESIALDEYFLQSDWGDVCAWHFRAVFGFMPRKGKTYKITVPPPRVEVVVVANTGDKS